MSTTMDDTDTKRRLARLEAELSCAREETSALRTRLDQIEGEHRACAAQYVELEQQNLNLTNLYVASYQLHGRQERSNVLAAIKEIVINLIGSEELIVYEASADRRELIPIDSFGVDESALKSVPFGHGPIGETASAGQLYVESDKKDFTAAVPLKLGDDVVGVVAIYSLLPQKSGLCPTDMDLFDVLASHGGTALFCATEGEKSPDGDAS